MRFEALGIWADGLEPVFSGETEIGFFVLFVWESGWAVGFGPDEATALANGRSSALRQRLG